MARSHPRISVNISDISQIIVSLPARSSDCLRFCYHRVGALQIKKTRFDSVKFDRILVYCPQDLERFERATHFKNRDPDHSSTLRRLQGLNIPSSYCTRFREWLFRRCRLQIIHLWTWHCCELHPKPYLRRVVNRRSPLRMGIEKIQKCTLLASNFDSSLCRLNIIKKDSIASGITSCEESSWIRYYPNIIGCPTRT